MKKKGKRGKNLRQRLKRTAATARSAEKDNKQLSTNLVFPTYHLGVTGIINIGEDERHA